MSLISFKEMGNCLSKNDLRKSAQGIGSDNNHLQNIHQVNPDIKVHTVVSAELDFDHENAMKLPLVIFSICYVLCIMYYYMNIVNNMKYFFILGRSF